MVNFYAPWCFWSNRLTPAWTSVAKRLHTRAYSESIKFIRVDCTSASGGELCKAQSIHAFPSIRIYRGSAHAFEPYEYGREENIMWLHLVKTSAEILLANIAEDKEKAAHLQQQIAHVSSDLKAVMERRAKGLDEDWSEDALSSEEEVAEDRDILDRIGTAVSSITGAKGLLSNRDIKKAMGMGLSADRLPDAEARHSPARAARLTPAPSAPCPHACSLCHARSAATRARERRARGAREARDRPGGARPTAPLPDVVRRLSTSICTASPATWLWACSLLRLARASPRSAARGKTSSRGPKLRSTRAVSSLATSTSPARRGQSCSRRMPRAARSTSRR